MTDLNDPRNKPPTEDDLQRRRTWLAAIGWTDTQIDATLKRQEDERQERRSPSTRKPWPMGRRTLTAVAPSAPLWHNPHAPPPEPQQA